MNKMTKKLLLSVLTVVLTVGALGTTTFAWFTLTSTANVQPFEAEVVGETGIEISLDNDANDDVWVTQLTPEMIQAYIEAEIGGEFKFNQMTSEDGITINDFGGGTPGAAAGYLEIGIQIRSNSAQTIAVTQIGLEQPSPFTWVASNSFLNAKGQDITGGESYAVKAINAARVSVQDVLGDVDENTLAETLVYELPSGSGVAMSDNTVLGARDEFNASFEYALTEVGSTAGDYPDDSTIADVATSLTTDVAGPLYEVTDDLNADELIGFSTTDDDSGTYYTAAMNALYPGAIDYYRTVTSSFPAGSDSITVAGTVTTLVTEVEEEFVTGVEVARLLNNEDEGFVDYGQTYSGKIVIRVWLEGWDPDMFNAILSDTVRISFQLVDPLA